MTSVVALDGLTSFLRLKYATYSCKRMRHSPTIGAIYLVQWQKLEEAGDFKCVFVVYCVLESKLISSSEWIVESVGQLYVDKSLALRRSWFDLLYNWHPNSELLYNNSLLELIYFLIIGWVVYRSNTLSPLWIRYWYCTVNLNILLLHYLYEIRFKNLIFRQSLRCSP